MTSTRIQDYFTELKEEWCEVRNKKHIIIVQGASTIIFFAIPIIFLNFIFSPLIEHSTWRIVASIAGTSFLTLLFSGIRRILPVKTAGLLSGKFISEIDNYNNAIIINIILICILGVLLFGKHIINSYVFERETK